MSNFPIWMTQEQADRLKADIEAAGFSDIQFQTLDAGAQLAISTKADGLVLTAKAHDSQNLADVVFNLKKQRDSRKGEGKDLGADDAGS